MSKPTTSSTWFFLSHVFFGVFQYDLGPPKNTLELRIFLINVFSLHLIGPYI